MIRWVLVIVALSVLVLVYLQQRFDYAVVLFGIHPQRQNTVFVVNRIVRMVINDGSCLLLIHQLFKRIDFVRIAGYLFLVELFVLLPTYLVFKLWLEGPSEISSPFLSQMHRLIVNPLLMIILLAGFYFQVRSEKKI